jgi:hypothetical protein
MDISIQVSRAEIITTMKFVFGVSHEINLVTQSANWTWSSHCTSHY